MSFHQVIAIVSPPLGLPPCMGGFCGCRVVCRRYWHTSRQRPAERLCSPGMRDVFQPLTERVITTAEAS